MLKKLNLGDDRRHVKSDLLSFMMHTSGRENHKSFYEVWQETLGYCEKSPNCFCDSPPIASQKDRKCTCKAVYIVDSPPSGQDQLYHKPNLSVLETANSSLGPVVQELSITLSETREAKEKACSLSIEKVIPILTFSCPN